MGAKSSAVAYDRAMARITHPDLMKALRMDKFPAEEKFAPKPEDWLDGDCWHEQRGGYLTESEKENSQWVLRINGWREKKFWLPKWGESPDSPNCQCPKELLTA
jgi:hypothetical protein